MPLKVISECVDRDSGRRYLPGSFFPESAPAEQIERLIGSGCLRQVSAKDLEAAEKSLAASARREAEAEHAEIEKTLEAARERRDVEIAQISDEIGKARRDAEDEKARITAEVEEFRAKSGGAPDDPAEVARRQINEDGLFDKTVPELKDVAASEGVDVSASAKKDDIVAAIRAKRVGA